MAKRGRPPKSTEQHKLDGTFQPCRHQNNTDIVVSNIISIPEKIKTPEEIKRLNNKKIEKAFKKHVEMLIKLKSICEADIIELTNLYIILNDIYIIRTRIDSIDLVKEFYIYEKLQRLFLKQIAAFNSLGAKFYLTPQVRAQMRLNDLQEIKEKIELEKKLKEAEQNPLQKLINKKKS